MVERLKFAERIIHRASGVDSSPLSFIPFLTMPCVRAHCSAKCDVIQFLSDESSEGNSFESTMETSVLVQINHKWSKSILYCNTNILLIAQLVVLHNLISSLSVCTKIVLQLFKLATHLRRRRYFLAKGKFGKFAELKKFRRKFYRSTLHYFA